MINVMKTQNWLHQMMNKVAARKLRRVFAVNVMASLIGTVTTLANAQTQLVSINAAGTNSGNSSSQSYYYDPKLSADGRFMVFWSDASDLVSNDTNGKYDVFVRDLQNGATALVSVNRDGTNSGNSYSIDPEISADGRFVAFTSYARDLVSNNTTGYGDIFVRDLQNGTTTLVSVNRDGTNSGNGSLNPVINADGRFVAFISSARDLVNNNGNNYPQVYVRDLQNGTTTLVSVNREGTNGGNGFRTYAVRISPDGRLVAFISNASDLVNNDTNDADDVFVRDLQNGTTILVSVNHDGTNSGNSTSFYPAISADGRFVAFESSASDLISNDTNGKQDVFVRDLQNGNMTLVSVSRDGTNVSNGSSGTPVISANGRFVAFISSASDLVSNDTNGILAVFVRDLQNGTTTIVSVNRDGTNSGNKPSAAPAISADGRFVAFESPASDLVSNDTNNNSDVYVRDLQNRTTILVSVNRDGTNSGNGYSSYPAISKDGRVVAFRSDASDLVSNDTNGTWDLFVNKVDQSPVSNAGADQTIITATGFAQITLNGSGSSDPDNDPLTYTWRENGTIIAGPIGSATSQVNLGAGSHTIELTVDDGRGGTDTDVVTITVKSAQDALDDLIAIVNSLNIKNNDKGIKNAWLTKLGQIQAYLQNGETKKTVSELNTFIKQVSAQSGKAISVSDADMLIAQAQAIIDAVNAASAPKIALESAEIATLPTNYALEQNYPNPFNPVTTIQFSVPRESYVRLKVYNAFGAEVATLVDQHVATGTYKVNWDASRLASGFYLYRLEAEGFAQTKKLLLMK
jgi:K319L-like, PKD domain/Secretion system C-terminal sorting domain/FIMAH domain/WD40-like Beta Propeller Repeat